MMFHNLKKTLIIITHIAVCEEEKKRKKCILPEKRLLLYLDTASGLLGLCRMQITPAAESNRSKYWCNT